MVYAKAIAAVLGSALMMGSQFMPPELGEIALNVGGVLTPVGVFGVPNKEKKKRARQ